MVTAGIANLMKIPRGLAMIQEDMSVTQVAQDLGRNARLVRRSSMLKR